MAIVKCFVCSKEFDRKESEIKRNKKKGRKTFCSRSCSGKHCIKNIPEEKRGDGRFLLKKGSEKDEYSPFRFFYNLCKRRAKEKPGLGFDLTLEDIKKQWEKQKGVCPYTGWKLKISECLSVKNKIRKSPDRASLDRIDSAKGYIKGNIQFISLISQYAKNDWDEEVIFEFANAVKLKK